MFKVNSVISFLTFPHAPPPTATHTHPKKQALHINDEDVIFDHHGWQDSLCLLIGAIKSSLPLPSMKE